MLKIRDLRKEKGITQKELANRIGTSNKNVWAWENGGSSPDIPTLKLLASFFDVSIDYLVGRVDDFGFATGSDTPLAQSEKEIIRILRALDANEREIVIKQIRALSPDKRK